MTSAQGRVIPRGDWAKDETLWKGLFEGQSIGTGVTVLFFSTAEVGAGPVLHVHPYDELFIVRKGRARFTVGDQSFEVAAGELVFGPADVPHKFENLGPDLLETTDIHLNDRLIQTDLEP